MTLTRPVSGWTFADLQTLPQSSTRYEIIEGELYEMPPPASAHAVTVLNLLQILGPIVAALRGWLLTAPLGVFITGADPVEPDVVVLLPGGKGRLAARGVEGPPDLVIEVLSPSNRGHDLLTKRALYGRGGVREYWIVDPDTRTIEILALDRDALHVVQSGLEHDTIFSPVLGNASIPISAIFARIEEIEA